jgi:hypothetical protein
MTFPQDEGRDCSRAWEAMPWVLQKSAPQDQQAWLASHLAHCNACSLEFAQQTRLRQALSLPTDIPLDANAGLERLLARIDAPDVKEAPLARARSSHGFMRALVAVILLQALGIGALGLKLWSENANPPYRTLSQVAAPVAPGALHVVPDPSMKLAEWNSLLHGLGLQVAGGPNDVGAYTLVPAKAAPAASTALDTLRATRGIRLAEPVSGTP